MFIASHTISRNESSHQIADHTFARGNRCQVIIIIIEIKLTSTGNSNFPLVSERVKENYRGISNEKMISVHSDSISLKMFRIHSQIIFLMHKIMNNKVNKLQIIESKMKK